MFYFSTGVKSTRKNFMISRESDNEADKMSGEFAALQNLYTCHFLLIKVGLPCLAFTSFI